MYLINRKRFTLNNIEVLLKADLHPANIEASIQHQSLTSLQELLSRSGLEAIESLRAFRYEIHPEDFSQLCQQNYSDLFRLQDNFQLMQQTDLAKSLNPAAQELYQSVRNILEEVSAFLEGMGIQGMAAGELLPKYHLEPRLALLRKDILMLQSKFQACSADLVLRNLLLDHFRRFTVRQECSQRELNYMEQLMSALLSVLTSPATENQDLILMHKVIELNFNSPGTYQYCRDKILEALEDTQGSTRRMMLLTWHLKAVRQLLAVPGVALNLQYPALSMLMVEFLQSEISYQESAVADQLANAVSPPKSQRSPLQQVSFGKFQLQLSQRALAIWSQTLISMGIIRLGLKDQRRFTEFLADHFTTAGLEEILPDNFRRRYKEKHSATSEILIGILERMILYIKQEYMGIPLPPKN